MPVYYKTIEVPPSEGKEAAVDFTPKDKAVKYQHDQVLYKKISSDTLWDIIGREEEPIYYHTIPEDESSNEDARSKSLYELDNVIFDWLNGNPDEELPEWMRLYLYQIGYVHEEGRPWMYKYYTQVEKYGRPKYSPNLGYDKDINRLLWR